MSGLTGKISQVIGPVVDVHFDIVDGQELQLPAIHDALKIKGSTKVGDAEKLFDATFGVTVQIKDKTGKILVPNEITIGKAARGEY